MIDLIKAKLRESKKNKSLQIHLVREYLQIYLLKLLADRSAFKNISFLDGTALRILYKLRRYSEDLDFNLVNNANFDFELLVNKSLKDLSLSGFNVEAEPKGDNVRQALYKFSGLLAELDLSPYKNQKLSIKLEIDVNPPKGANIETSLVQGEFLFTVTHHDLPSLFAGKLHAFFQRGFTKGRDYYDLLWYLKEGIDPNLEFLNNALQQSEAGFSLSKSDWRLKLLEKLASTDLNRAAEDVSRFLFEPKEAENISYKTFEKLISNARAKS